VPLARHDGHVRTGTEVAEVRDLGDRLRQRSARREVERRCAINLRRLFDLALVEQARGLMDMGN
jgi:hypothetical protein